MSCCVKVMSWLTCVCIGACLYEFLLYTACLVLHICIYAHLHAHSARALVRALAQASWVKEVYLGARTKTLSQEKTLSQAKTFQHLAVALRHSWCLPQPICSKAVRVSWRVCMSLYSKRFFPFVGLVYEYLFCKAYLVLLCCGGSVRWISGHGAILHQLWCSKLPDCTYQTCRHLASTLIF